MEILDPDSSLNQLHSFLVKSGTPRSRGPQKYNGLRTSLVAQGLTLCTSTAGHKGLIPSPKSSTCLAVWPKKNKERKKYNGLNHVKSNRGRARSVLSDVFCHVPHIHDSSMCTCQVPMHRNPSNPQGYKGLSASTFDFWFVFLPFELQSLIPAIVDDGHSFAIDLQGPLATSY